MSNSTTIHGDDNKISQIFLKLFLIKKEWIEVVGDICIGSMFFMAGVISFYIMSYNHLIDGKYGLPSQEYIGAFILVLFYSVLGGFLGLYIWLWVSYLIRKFLADKKNYVRSKNE